MEQLFKIVLNNKNHANTTSTKAVISDIARDTKPICLQNSSDTSSENPGNV